MGTGGGGDPKQGLETLRQDLASGRKLVVSDVAELDPSSIVVCAYYCGSIPSPGRKIRKEALETRMAPEALMRTVLNTMKEAIHGDISSIIAVELGGANTAIALHLAALAGLPVVDGDQVGRSAPELVHSTYHVHGAKATPAVVADTLGNILVVKEYSDIQRYEMIARSLSVLAGGAVIVLDTPATAAETSRLALTGTLSKCVELGATVRRANEKRTDPISEVVKLLQGYMLFHGKVSQFNLNEEDGFLMGRTGLRGLGDWRGHRAEVWVKNENMIAWRDGKLVAIAPDPIILLDEKGYGVTNSRIRKGMEVYVVGAKAHDIWRTPRGIELMGPRHFGFRFDYNPIEKLVGT